VSIIPKKARTTRAAQGARMLFGLPIPLPAIRREWARNSRGVLLTSGGLRRSAAATAGGTRIGEQLRRLLREEAIETPRRLALARNREPVCGAIRRRAC